MNGMATTGPLPSLAPPMRMIAPVRTGLEILAQCPDVDCIVVPVGGGGLIAGKHPSSSPPPPSRTCHATLMHTTHTRATVPFSAAAVAALAYPCCLPSPDARCCAASRCGAGIAIAVKSILPHVEIIGVEPALCPSWRAAGLLESVPQRARGCQARTRRGGPGGPVL